jgi:hypothetical protein
MSSSIGVHNNLSRQFFQYCEGLIKLNVYKAGLLLSAFFAETEEHPDAIAD